jgi:hypothetical protein
MNDGTSARQARSFIRIYELARELGTDSRTIMRLAHPSCYRSASSTLTRDDIERIRAAYEQEQLAGRPGGPLPPLAAPPPARRTVGMPLRRPDPSQSTEQWLLAGRRAKYKKAPKKKAAPRGEMSLVLEEAAGGLHGPRFYDACARGWVTLMYLPQQAAAWVRAGLSPADFTLASRLDAQGIRPRHLSFYVNGSTVLEKLIRQDRPLTPIDIRDLLRREAQL